MLPYTLSGERTFMGTGADQAMFYYYEDDRKVRNVFAIVYSGQLYFQVDQILDNRNKKDRMQDSDFPNSFCRVLLEGERYFYMETGLGNVWAKGLGVNAGVSTSAFNATKGIVWDVAAKEFNIFRDCKDFNLFLADVTPEKLLDCDADRAYSPMNVGRIIDTLK